MKKTLLYILGLTVLAGMMTSCYKQDDIYQEYVVVGGYTYPAKAINLTASPGENRVVLHWDLPMDPSIRTAKVFWDNYSDSLSISYSSFPDGHVSVSIDNLEERSYTFDVVNYDEPGNKSLAAELTARPLGDSWLVTHSERRLENCYMSNDTAIITLSKATDEMVGTKFKVYDLNGNFKEYERFLPAEENTIRIPHVLKGKKFEFTSGYFETNAADTIWNRNWTRSSIGIPYPLPASAWSVTPTTNQERSGYDAFKIFDGVYDDSQCRWFSASNTTYRNVFPKILAIDSNVAEGQEYTITQLTFYQHPTNDAYRYMKDVNIYAGDKAYDPDITAYAGEYGDVVTTTVISTDNSRQDVLFPGPVKARYMALVFRNSRSTAYGYIDLWELVPYGFLESEAE